MSKQPTINGQDEPVEVETEDQELDIEEGDYGFVITSTGELRHMFTPDSFYLDPPPVVRKIFKLFGIKDINTVGMDADSDTIH